MAAKKHIYIDALPISTLRNSGVGHVTHAIIDTLIKHPDFQDYELILVTTWFGYRWLRRYNFPRVRYIRLPIITRIMNRLPTTPLMPWMDLFLGRGIYIFPNFRSWPLLLSKSATYVHDIAFMLHPDSLTDRHRTVMQRNVANWARRSTAVVTVSDSSKTEIVEHLHIPADKIIVAHNGVDLDDLYPRPAAEIVQVQKKHNLPASYVLFWGNIEPRKNLLRLIRAYTALSPELRDAHPLVLIGGMVWLDDQVNAEIDRAAQAGATVIRPTQYIEDQDRPAIMSGAVALAWIPIHEGFGMPPLEAMACGIPVLTSDIPVLREAAGEAALMVNPFDEAAITAGLQRILTDQTLRARLIKTGRDRVKLFTWDLGLATLLDWIKSAARGANK